MAPSAEVRIGEKISWLAENNINDRPRPAAAGAVRRDATIVFREEGNGFISTYDGDGRFERSEGRD